MLVGYICTVAVRFVQFELLDYPNRTMQKDLLMQQEQISASMSGLYRKSRLGLLEAYLFRVLSVWQFTDWSPDYCIEVLTITWEFSLWEDSNEDYAEGLKGAAGAD